MFGIFGKVLFAGVVAAGLSGCGGSVVTPVPSGELILADPATAAHFSLSVVNGAATLAGMGSAGTVSADAELTDGVTGERYGLTVSGGALTLVPAASGVGASEIEFVDTVTAKAYTLAVVRGALTLSGG
jgi:hypothetical protein